MKNFLKIIPLSILAFNFMPPVLSAQSWHILGVSEFNRIQVESAVHQIEGVSMAKIDLGKNILMVISDQKGKTIDTKMVKAAVEGIKGVEVGSMLSALPDKSIPPKNLNPKPEFPPDKIPLPSVPKAIEK